MPRPHKTVRPDILKCAAEGLDIAPNLVTADGVIPIDEDRTFSLSKAGAAGAHSVAAPGQANVGRELTFITGTDFQHVVTFTGTTLEDGTTGLNLTWTAAAFAGSSLTVVARSATRWSVKSFNLGAIAP